MKKEVLIAIAIGLVMGLIITYGFYRVKNTVSSAPTTDLAAEIASSSASPKVVSTIAIHSPEEGLIQSEPVLKVAGTTTASSLVVLNYEDQSVLTESDDSGNFSFDIELSEGPHILTVSVIENDGSITTEERTVVITDIFEVVDSESEINVESDQNPTDDSEEN